MCFIEQEELEVKGLSFVPSSKSFTLVGWLLACLFACVIACLFGLSDEDMLQFFDYLWNRFSDFGEVSIYQKKYIFLVA